MCTRVKVLQFQQHQHKVQKSDSTHNASKYFFNLRVVHVYHAAALKTAKTMEEIWKQGVS